MKTPDIEKHVVWHGDGSYSPSCGICGWEGKPRHGHAETRAAVMAHMRSKRHKDRLRAEDVVTLDADVAAKLDRLAGLMRTDRAGYLRWVLTGKAPTTKEEDR